VRDGVPAGGALVERFYIKGAGKGVCLHALAAMLTLLAPLLKGAPARALGIGKEEDTGYTRRPRARPRQSVSFCASSKMRSVFQYCQPPQRPNGIAPSFRRQRSSVATSPEWVSV